MIHNIITSTNPFICHFPGKSYRKGYGRIVFENMVSNNIGDVYIPNNLAILSLKTCDESSLLESQLNHTTNFYSYKINLSKKWQHIYKIDFFLQHINKIVEPYILYLDAYDVLLNNNNLMSILNYVDNNKITFNAEKNFYNTVQDPYLYKNIKHAFDTEHASHVYRYLNSGCFICKKSVLIDFLQEISSLIKNKKTPFSKLNCDQAAIQLYWYLYDRKHINLIDLDLRCNLFMCMNYLSPKDILLNNEHH